MAPFNSFKVALGLLHYPVLGKQHEIIRTSVTNLDIHDIARSCRTFGVSRYEIMTPIQKQRDLVGRLLEHWKMAKSKDFNPFRHDALEKVFLSEGLEASIESLTEYFGAAPYIVATATGLNPTGSIAGVLDQWQENAPARPLFILFGTGHGLAPSVIEACDGHFPEIQGVSLVESQKNAYNHLSVRSAVAIYLHQIGQELQQRLDA